jgi:hypothetical protein
MTHTPIAVTCPDDLRHDGLEGCGTVFIDSPDFEGLYDCPNCGLFFDPTYTEKEEKL